MPFAIAAGAAALLAWIYLLAGHGAFWRTDQRLPSASESTSSESAASASVAWPDVVAIVPARDEASMLPDTLPTLLAQDYAGQFSVVLVDDESTDGTPDVAARLDQVGRLKVISGSPTPPGWAGKVWAMAQGMQAAGDPEYLLFTDADISYAPGVLGRLVASASGRALVSQMALLRSDAPAERLLIPAFVYFFAQLYPFSRVNSRRSRTAAAAGGCMLVRREALAAAGGLDAIKGARIDDVALGGLLKRAANDCWLGFSTDVTSRRSYRLSDVWDMVARSAYTQLRYSPAALVGTVIGLVWLYLVPPAAAVAGLALLAAGAGSGLQAIALTATGLAAWAIMSVTYLPMLRLSKLSALRAPTLPLIATMYAAMTITSAWRHLRGRGGAWKGRVIG
ncbi:MAG TPA: glycosyltransferase [Streptosporangiaceae bacterium]|nr:glycosyltransferase [Streptosporangiaceae bacterium]